MYGFEKRNSAPDWTLVALITKRGLVGEVLQRRVAEQVAAVGLGDALGDRVRA